MSRFLYSGNLILVRMTVSLLTLLLLTAISFPLVFAGGSVPGDPFDPPSDYELPTNGTVTGSSDVFEFLGNIFGFLYYLFFAVAAFMFLYAGFLYLTAADDADKISKASKILIYGFIAVVVAVVSVGLAAVLAGIVTGGSP